MLSLNELLEDGPSGLTHPETDGGQVVNIDKARVYDGAQLSHMRAIAPLGEAGLQTGKPE